MRIYARVGQIGLLLLSCLMFNASASGQFGGKAEPKRIEFVAGRSTTTVTGRLSNGQEMEYAFAARKGQSVTVRNSNTGLFDFRIFSQELDLETEFESSRTLTVELPATGDYMFFIRKKQVKAPRTAKYSLTISIK